MAVDKIINETQGNDIIDKLDDIASNLNNVTAIIPAKFGMGLATCDTAADVAAKTCTIPNFALTNGAPVSVKFTYANSASNPTLNINGTGAKPMYYKGTAMGTNVLTAGDIATFIYDTNGIYHIINIDTLAGPGAGTVTSVGATDGITTDQSSGTAIQGQGSVKLNLKSNTAYSGTVADPAVTDKVYPVALDGDGHPVVGVPWTDTTYSNESPAEGGTAVSLVTTGDKYTWNHKLDATANAASAAKLNDGSADYAVGSATKGVYFNNGIPTVMTYEVNTNVPSDAVFTDTTYTGSGAIDVDSTTHVISAATATTTTAGVVTLSDAIPSSGAVNTKVATEKAVADSISGKAIGAGSSTTNAIATFAGTDGKTLADSAVTIAKNATGVTDDDTKVPTSKAVKTYVDATATGISRYLGTIDAVNELSTDAKKGDFYIVSTAWAGVHIGDEIIAEKNGPTQTIDGTNWKLLHNEADTNTTYEFGSGTTNGSFSVTPSSTGTAQSVAVYGLKSAAYTDSTDYATSSHVHGSITNDGKITDTGVALANGDSLAFVDSSDSSKIKKTSVTFDGSTNTKALTQKGTWETFNNYTHPTYTEKANGLYKITVNSLGHVSAATTATGTDLPSHNHTKSQITDFPTSMTPTSHTHGNIQNGGTLQTNDITIASGDKIVVTDSSDSNKIARTSISFDGSTATQALTKKGTWETFNNYSHPTSAGNKHIPSGGSSGQVLIYGGSSGSAAWGDVPYEIINPADFFTPYSGGTIDPHTPTKLFKQGKHIFGILSFKATTATPKIGDIKTPYLPAADRFTGISYVWQSAGSRLLPSIYEVRDGEIIGYGKWSSSDYIYFQVDWIIA